MPYGSTTGGIKNYNLALILMLNYDKPIYVISSPLQDPK